MLRDVSTFVQGQRTDDDERDEFHGIWMLVAQWDGVHPYPHGADDHEGISEEFLDLVGIEASISVNVIMHWLTTLVNRLTSEPFFFLLW